MTSELFLRDQRQILGLTQKQLADSLDMTTNHIAMMERGERPVPKRIILAVDCLIRRAADETCSP